MLSEKEIRCRARKVLRQYDKYKRIAGKDVFLQSVVLSDMPKNATRVNYNENRLINRITAKNILQSISEALAMLDSEHKELLERIYIYQKNKTQLYIADAMGMSVKTLERHHAIALVEFAEAYHYENLLA